MWTIGNIAGTVGTTLRDRSRSVKRRLMEIGRIARSKGAQRQEKLTRAYQQLFAATSRVVGQAKRFAQEIRTGVKRSTDVIQQTALEGLRQHLERFVPRVQQVVRQATKSATRKREQKKRWFKNGQRWRTGCEGRISVVKRRHGLTRSRYKKRSWYGTVGRARGHCGQSHQHQPRAGHAPA
jgi:hypothetical protein